MKLLPFWNRDSRSWFTLEESTFNQSDIANTQLGFDLALTTLPEDVIEQVCAILHAVDDIPDPYRALKVQLVNLFTPKPLDLVQKIIHSGELGDRRPSQLMESMLALLPPGEPDGMIFKVPADIRNHVVTAGFNSTAREMAAMADILWFAANNNRSGNKRSQAVAAVQEDVEDL